MHPLGSSDGYSRPPSRSVPPHPYSDLSDESNRKAVPSYSTVPTALSQLPLPPPPQQPPLHGRPLERVPTSFEKNTVRPSPYLPPPPPPLPSTTQPPVTRRLESQHFPRVPLFTRTVSSPYSYQDVPVYFPRKALETFKKIHQPDRVHTQPISLPPEEDSRFFVQDDGNASPRLLTCNMFAVPQNSLILQQTLGGRADTSTADGRKDDTHVLGLLCQPLAIPSSDYVLHDFYSEEDRALPPDWEKVPVISQAQTLDLLPVTPLRCRLCQAYINPFCTVSYSTNMESCSITCNFCQTRTTTSFETFQSCTTCQTDTLVLSKIPNSDSSSSSSSSSSFASTRFGTVEYEVDGPFITRFLEQDEHKQQRIAPPLIYLYALDASSGATILQAYLDTLHVVGTEIASHWNKQQSKQNIYPRIGFIIYDDFGQIYIPYWNRDRILQVALMLDVVQDPFIPLPLSEWTFHAVTYENPNLSNSLEDFYHLLRQIPSVIQNISSKSCRGIQPKLNFTGAALAALTHALQSKTDCFGGRIVALTCTRPNAGLGALRDLESSRPGSSSTAMYAHTESERILYTSLLKLVDSKTPFNKTQMDDRAYSFYHTLIQQCQQFNISIDIIMTTPTSMGRTFLGLATLGDVCQRTCGSLKWLKYNDLGDIQGNWREQLREELLRSALVYSGSDAILKLRCSNGLHVKKTIPNKYLPLGIVVDSSEFEFTRVNSDTCITIELEYDIGGIPKDHGTTHPLVYFQTAFLYTTFTGHRRLRVSTLALPTTTSILEAFQGIRFASTCTLITRKAIDDLYEPTDSGNLRRVGSLIMDRCVNILANYRLHTNAKHSSWDTLVLPENLKLLPLFCLGLRKSIMLRSSLTKDATISNIPFPNGDERAHRLFYGTRITPAMSMLHVHPAIYSLLHMRADEGEWSQALSSDIKDRTSIVILPEPIPPSVGLLKQDGIYILDDGFTLYLFIGPDVSVEQRSELLSYQCGSPTLQVSSPLSKKISRILLQIRRYSTLGGTQQQSIRPVFAPLVLVIGSGGCGFRKGIDDVLEKFMIECCVDDSSGGDSSYGDFLAEVHRRVKGKTI